MAYNNFAAAWAVFAGRYDSNNTRVENMFVQMMTFYEHLTAVTDVKTRTALNDAYIIFGMIYMIFSFGLDMQQTGVSDNCFYESIYHASLEPIGGEVTMDSILSIMAAATDSELMNFIGLVDAYRQSLWNKPFNAEYFAALARGFI